MPKIHPTALVSDEAHLAEDVIVGPFAIIDGPAEIAAGCNIGPRATITGRVIIGAGNIIGNGSIIGGHPQDLSYDPNIESGVTLGANNRIYEYVTIHRSASEGKNTTIGDENFLMTQCHFAHDCHLGNKNVIANNTMFAGYVTVGNNTFIGGGAGFHQFINVGDYALSKGNASISKDIPPYCLAHGDNCISGLNVIGLRRAGFSADERNNIKAAYTALFQSKLSREEAIALAEKTVGDGPGQLLIEAVKNPSRKGVLSKT